ncbi:MAG: hypothetical protein M0Z27_13660, partial [Thermaerobacter sp.]|nr:hypothetical protein [Thermaerobacter sp.]
MAQPFLVLSMCILTKAAFCGNTFIRLTAEVAVRFPHPAITADTARAAAMIFSVLTDRTAFPLPPLLQRPILP